MHKTSKTIGIVLAAVILLTVAVSVIALWKARPTSKGDPETITDEFAESEETAPPKVSVSSAQPHEQTDALDLDVRDLAPKSSPAQVVGGQVVYDRKEIPDETTK